jgi:hypothetical protein
MRIRTPDSRVRNRRRLLAVTVLGVLFGSAAAEAQDRDENCIKQYNALIAGTTLRPLDATNPANGCRRVAVALGARWDDVIFVSPDVDPRDLSATRDQTTAAPGDVTSPVEPVEAAGGSLAAVGTDKGAGALAAIAINPSIFFVDPSNTQAVARWSRFTDVTLLVPANDVDDGEEKDAEEDGDEGTDYVGIRWGLNITGLRRGSALHEAVKNAYDQFLAGGTTQIQQVTSLLTAAESDDDLKNCMTALLAAESLDADAKARIAESCDGVPDPADPNVIRALQDAIQAARIQADSRYFGLDLRADFGDLSLAGIDTVSGTSIFGGVGWGRRSVRSTDAAMGLRIHAGGRYWDTEDEEDTEDEDDANFAVEGGAAFEAIRFYDYQRLTLVAGLDGRYQSMGVADGEDEASINLRGSLNVPITPTASVSVNLVAPVVGERRGPVLSIKANWRLLRSPSF